MSIVTLNYTKMDFVLRTILQRDHIFKRLSWWPKHLLKISTTAEYSQIRLPNRIERNSTDVLEALEKIVSADSSAAHYKFHDDPYLIPLSNFTSRSYALSYESGRKAAAWVRQEHVDLFQHKVADPAIMSYLPPPAYDNKDDLSEDFLKIAISDAKITEAIGIYNNLQSNVSIATKQSLLELLCFYNSDENNVTCEDFLEEKWYRILKKNNNNTWSENAEIKGLFEFLKVQDMVTAGAAYSTLISGTVKYCNIQAALKLYEESKEKSIPLNINAYNSLISILPSTRERNALKASVTEILNLMVTCGIKPNIGTLNAVVKLATYMDSHIAKDYISSVLAELNKLNIKPSLTTYCYVLVVHYHMTKDDNVSVDILTEILSQLEQTKITMQDLKDVMFFPTAMEIASQILHDYDLGLRVHNLLLSDDNYKFINGNHAESIYYKKYITLRLKTDPLEEFMEFYNSLVPNMYIPESDVMTELLDTLELNSADVARNYLPHIWSQIIMFNFVDMNGILEKAFNIMYKHCAPPSPQSVFHKQFADAAYIIWKHIQEPLGKRMKKQMYSGNILGCMAVLLLRDNRVEEMLEIVSYILKEEGFVVGTMKPEHIDELLTGCILNGHGPGAIDILQYAASVGSKQLETMAQKVCKELPLTVKQENKISNIVENEMRSVSKYADDHH